MKLNTLLFFLLLLETSFAQNTDWIMPFVGQDYGSVTDIALDEEGHLLVAGIHSGPVDIQPGDGVTMLPTNGQNDVMLVKYDADGQLVWGHHFGNTNPEFYSMVTALPDGQIIVVFRFNGTIDADPGPGVVSLTSVSTTDIAVIRLFADGTFSEAWQLGAPGSQLEPTGLITDGSGDYALSGTFTGTIDVDPGPGVTNLVATQQAGFVIRMDVTGPSTSELDWAVKLDAIYPMSLAAHSDGTLYTTGYFFGNVDADPGAGTFPMNGGMNGQGFVISLSNSGVFNWAFDLGGTNADQINAVAVDSNGDIVITGYFNSTADFDPGPGTTLLTGDTSPLFYGDLFVAKYASDSGLLWARAFGVSGSLQFGFGIACGANNMVSVTGLYDMTVDFDPGPGVFELSNYGVGDAFILSLNANGEFIWAGHLGSYQSDSGSAIAMTSATTYFGGTFNNSLNSDLDPTTDVWIPDMVDASNDGYVVKVNITNCDVQAQITSIPAECGTAGSASITSVTGTAPFTYLWNDPLAQSTETATGLAPGIYSLSITDAEGCTVVEEVEITLVTNCPGDFDGDQWVGVSDLLPFSAAFGCDENCCPFDMDNNGMVGINDLLVFLSEYGNFCP